MSKALRYSVWSVLARGSHSFTCPYTRTIRAFASQQQSIAAYWLVLTAPIPTWGWPGWVYQIPRQGLWSSK